LFTFKESINQKGYIYSRKYTQQQLIIIWGRREKERERKGGILTFMHIKNTYKLGDNIVLIELLRKRTLKLIDMH